MSKPQPSTAVDVRNFKKGSRARRGELLMLPSGLRILAIRPSLDWWLRHAGKLPQTMAARQSGSSEVAPPLTAEEIVQFSKWSTDLVCEVIVSPVVRLDPGEDEIHPSDIDDDDLVFITRFAGGEIDGEGRSLDNFSGRPQSSAPAGADGK